MGQLLDHLLKRRRDVNERRPRGTPKPSAFVFLNTVCGTFLGTVLQQPALQEKGRWWRGERGGNSPPPALVGTITLWPRK